MTSNQKIIYVGIDVSKHKLDVFNPGTQEHFIVDNTQMGINKILKRCLKQNTHFVMEATGGYERLARIAFSKKGYLVSILNAKRVRDFARSQGKLAKTDKIDAQIISEFAACTHPAARSEFDERQEKLIGLETRRSQITLMLSQEKNRLEKASVQLAKSSIKRNIKKLEKEAVKITAMIEALIASDAKLTRKAEQLLSVKGIGPKTMMLLLALLPELGTLSSKQIAALIGLAPFNVDSGKMRGKRKIYGGRKDIRNGLFIATLSAIRYNPAINKFYERLRATGKKKMICITACSRKLICIINTIIGNDTIWVAEPKQD